MIDYSIVEVDLNDKDRVGAINRLLAETLICEMPDDQIEKWTRTNSANDNLYLAAIEDGQVIGFNAFIAHDLNLNGSPIRSYQSCWTGTSKEHRNKKIFQNLINTAKEIFSPRDAAFIFGFANENSKPIMIKKLGFRETPSLKWQVPNIPVIRDLFVNSVRHLDLDLEKNQIFQNDRKLIEWKKVRYGDEVLAIEVNDSLIWGKVRERKKFGVNLRCFEIGGVDIADPNDITPIFTKLWSSEGRIDYFQLATTSHNSYNILFRNLRPAQTECLIVFDLNLATHENTRFNFFDGVKDVF